MATDFQKRQAALWEHKWLKNEQPFYKVCLNCQLSCSQKIRHAGASYDIFSCPKKDKGEPMFPYKYNEMLKEHNEKEKENGKHG